MASVSTMLEAATGPRRASPFRLLENRELAFEGCKVNGDGFLLDADEAKSLLAMDARYSQVVRPYLGGKDLNSRPAADASRWAIDFAQMEELEAKQFPAAFALLEQRVKPIREKAKAKPLRDRWWIYEKPRPSMRAAVRGLVRVPVIALTSTAVVPLQVASDQVLSNSLGVFALATAADFAVLSSSMHQVWVVTYGSTLETRIRYTPSDVFETFPRPSWTDRLDDVGLALDSERAEIMTRRGLGLTKLYNGVNAPSEMNDADVNRLRELHVEVDEATMAAYGWDDVALDHGFHTYRQMERFTVSPAARVEILDRLLELNHERARAEGQDVPEQGELF